MAPGMRGRYLVNAGRSERPRAPDIGTSLTKERPAASGLHVGILVEQRYLSQTQPMGLATALRARGHRVSILDPDATPFRMGDERWLADLDILVERGRSWELLCLVSWAEARGIPTINRRAAIGAVHNKAEMEVALAEAHVPIPRTYVGPVQALKARLGPSGRGFPIVLKPMFGDNSRRLRVVRDAAELAGLEWPEPVALAQELVPGDGYDRKVYGIGDEVWVVKRPGLLASWVNPSAPRMPEDQRRSELVPVTPADRELAARCRRLFGLDFYGIDCIRTPGGPVVIEVNEFPNYTGVSNASERLADYVIRSGHAAARRGT